MTILEDGSQIGVKRSLNELPHNPNHSPASETPVGPFEERLEDHIARKKRPEFTVSGDIMPLFELSKNRSNFAAAFKKWLLENGAIPALPMYFSEELFRKAASAGRNGEIGMSRGPWMLKPGQSQTNLLEEGKPKKIEKRRIAYFNPEDMRKTSYLEKKVMQILLTSSPVDTSVLLAATGNDPRSLYKILTALNNIFKDRLGNVVEGKDFGKWVWVNRDRDKVPTDDVDTTKIIFTPPVLSRKIGESEPRVIAAKRVNIDDDLARQQRPGV